MLDVNYLKALFDYDCGLGTFTYKRTVGRNKEGSIAGTVNHHSGYVYIKILGKQYSAHRLAWLYVYGILPYKTDHINGIKSNNWISNLRNTDYTGNNQNIRKPYSNNSTGFLGVSRKKDKFIASIRLNNKLIYLGSFNNPEVAHEAYIKAKRTMHETCTI